MTCSLESPVANHQVQRLWHAWRTEGGGYRYPERVIEEIEFHLHDAHHPGDVSEGKRIGSAVLQCELGIFE